MPSFFPSSSDRSTDSEVRVVGLEDDESTDLLAALSSDTAQEILIALDDEPMTPTEIVDEVGSSLQNVHYHLENLVEAGAIREIDTEYSSKGREMAVYAPSGEPLVIVSGTESAEIENALRNLLGGVAVLAVASFLVQVLLPDVPTRKEIMSAAGTPPMPVPPGIVFFAGGALVLVAAFLIWYARS